MVKPFGESYVSPFKSFITTQIYYVSGKTKLVLAYWIPRYSSIILVLSLSAIIFGCFGNWMCSELLNNYLHAVKVFSLQQKNVSKVWFNQFRERKGCVNTFNLT